MSKKGLMTLNWHLKFAVPKNRWPGCQNFSRDGSQRVGDVWIAPLGDFCLIHFVLRFPMLVICA